jgi:hypothetical protein
VTVPGDAPGGLSLDDRALRLDVAIAQDIGNGARLDARGQTHAVLVYGSGGVLLHITFAVLTLMTCGLFVFPWIVWANTNRTHRVTLDVDPYGRVTRAG